MYDFADAVTSMPAGFVNGVGDIISGGKDAGIGLMGIPQRGYETFFGAVTTITNTPTSLGNNAQIISDNAAQISNDAKETVDNLKPIMLIGIALFAFKTISEFDSKEMGSNLTRAAMFA
jgi:hypothetical protein